MRLFDSHSHLHDRKFDSDRDEVLARAREAGVGRILTLGTTIESSRAAIALADATPEVIAAAGIHPSDAADWNDETAARLEALLKGGSVAVLGEIGLDYYWYKDPEVHRQQQLAFREQIRMARRLGFAVSIHCRESNDDVIRILQEENGAEIGGVLHCFSGTSAHARAGIAMGFFLGVGGTATYKNSGALRDVLRSTGLDHLIIETDAPYLPPEPKRGRRNEPAFVAHTAASLAALFDVSVEELGERTWRNAERAFRLP